MYLVVHFNNMWMFHCNSLPKGRATKKECVLCTYNYVIKVIQHISAYACSVCY